jgi:hypothetical protein
MNPATDRTRLVHLDSALMLAGLRPFDATASSRSLRLPEATVRLRAEATKCFGELEVTVVTDAGRGTWWFAHASTPEGLALELLDIVDRVLREGKVAHLALPRVAEERADRLKKGPRGFSADTIDARLRATRPTIELFEESIHRRAEIHVGCIRSEPRALDEAGQPRHDGRWGEAGVAPVDDQLLQ